MERYEAGSADDVTEIVTAAIANESPLEIGGNFTKTGLGRPVEAVCMLSTRGMRGVHFYEPSELVISLGPGTPMQEIISLLDGHGQELAFEPIDYGLLYGSEPLTGTIGGVVATNASGPRRIKAGAARDHVLGFHAISGRGEAFQSGGRVMKNVTGYDMSKLMTGSYGTLAVLTDITLKVLPKAEMEETLLLAGLDNIVAANVMTEASGLPHEVSSLAHLPSAAARRMSAVLDSHDAVTALRLEGPEVSVTTRKAELMTHFADRGGTFATLATDTSRAFWSGLRDCAPLAACSADIWRVSTAPTRGAQFVGALETAGLEAESYFDWAGGLVWLATSAPTAEAATKIRRALDALGGHATLVRASAEARSEVDVFEPQPAALAALTARVKHGFDPERVLNRGRMRKDL